MKKSCYCLLISFLLCITMMAQPLDSHVHTILFLGNSITYAGGYIADVESAYTMQHPGSTVTFINLGLPSETVSGLSEEGHAGGRFPRPDLHERLHRILSKIKPDIVFACYGMNDGIYLPFDEMRFQKYKDGINWLHDSLAKTGARVVMLTPPVYDEQRGGVKGYGAVLDKYSDWLLSQKKSARWEVVDIHNPMKTYLEAHRALDKTLRMDGFSLANDGVHPGEAGHWLMAKQVLTFLGEKEMAKYASIKNAMETQPNGLAVWQLVAERQNFMKDAWLSATGHTRPEMKTGMPLNDAKIKATEIEKQIAVLLNR